MEIVMRYVFAFLGIEFARNHINKTLKITRSDYTKTFLERSSMEDCKAVVGATLRKIEDHHLDETRISDRFYLQSAGSMIYMIACTRPDLCVLLVDCRSRWNPRRFVWTCISRFSVTKQGHTQVGLFLAVKRQKTLDIWILQF